MSVTCKNLVPCLISFQQLGRSSVAATFTSCTCPARWSAIPFVKGLKLPAIPFVRGPKGVEREEEHSRRERLTAGSSQTHSSSLSCFLEKMSPLLQEELCSNFTLLHFREHTEESKVDHCSFR